MKKFFLAVAAMAMLATACTKDDAAVVSNESLVSFSVSSPELQTRAYGDGAEATVLHYAFYDEGNNLLNAISAIGEADAETQSVTLVNGKATINVHLVEGRTYSAIFWASAPDAAEVYDVNWDARTVEMATELTANNEDYDAFYSYTIGIDPAKKTHKIELTRPFAQLNIATKDLAAAVAAGVDVKATKVTVDAYNKLKFAVKNIDGVDTGVAEVDGDKVAFTYDWAPVITNEKVMTDYDLISMNYVLVDARTLVNVSLRMSEVYTDGQDDAATDIVRNYTTVPVQRNYRTYIVGNLLTTQNDFNVETKPGFDGTEEYVVWDGETVTKPAYDEATKTYTVKSGAELAWLAALVNGTLPATMRSTEATAPAETLKGVTIVLDEEIEDIDLGGHQWTPIGNSTNKFQGTFDGNGKVIKNLVVSDATKSNLGFFGFTTDGEIKNLTIENAKVSGRLNVGVVAGTPYTSKYTNITVQGHIEVDGMAYVGGVGGKNAYANWTNVTVNADEDSYVKANSIENGTAYRTYVGGVVGFNGEGGHSFTNITSNIDVYGTTCDVGGLFGIAHYGNKFENCSCSGNVEITDAAEAADAQEMGGIAGVWNNGGADVVFTNCEFTGELTSNIEGVEFYYGGLVGKPYSATGAGKLILDGVEYTVAGVNHKQLNEILAETGELVFANDMECKANGTDAVSNAYGKTGLTQLNGGVIDGQGHTLSVKGANGTWDSAINTTGGTIKNLTIDSGFRGIFINHNSDVYGKVYLENVVIDGSVYTISCDQGTNSGLEATNSTFNGWTSYAVTIGDVKFTNCSFGEGQGYAFCRPYAPTTFVGCEFEEGYEIDARAACVFEDCTLNGEPLTVANIATLVTSNLNNATINGGQIVASGITKDAEGNYSISNGAAFEDVNSALENGGNLILTEDVSGESATTAPYGNKYALKQDGGVIDGGGHKLDMECYGDDYGIMTSGGTVKNITIEEGCRAIMIMYPTEDIILDNVTIGGDGVLYPINTGEAGSEGVNLIVTNSTLAGWTSYSNIESASFTNVTFKQGTYYNNIYGRVLKPYVNTTITDCSFIEHMNLDLSGLTNGHKVTFKNCTVNGQAVTASVFTVPANDAEYDTELFTVDLPSWATSINDCVIFE